MTLSHRIRATALLAITTAAIAGCGSSVEGSARPGEIDVRALDIGNYPTVPLDERYLYSPSMGNGFNLALQRLGDHVVNGTDIDPKFGYGTGAVPFLDTDRATTVLAKATAPVLEANRMMFGFSVGHSEKQPDRSGKPPADSAFTTVTVMQFPDAAAASKAAAELDEADFAVAPDRNQRVPVPDYPDAHTHWRPGVASIGSTMAHGSYVVDMFVGGKDPEPSQLTALVASVYKAQVPLLDSLPPLDREGVLRLPYDANAMLRRTLNFDTSFQPDFASQAVADPRGFLHRVTDQNFWRRLVTDAGVERFATSGMAFSGVSMLFRTRDADAARRLSAAILEHGYSAVADKPAGIPGANCGELQNQSQGGGNKRYRCVLSYRGYAAVVESDQILDTQQRAAAQYALLANSTW
ncbi:DUF7373 family lipoprotein [Nocardia seriolae]|uniref:DUF7373 family lipoprotein n=1 Tax=Nocardia seriolae TaxID=37332 RepID=UPI002952CACF|nr:hypothetical protein [Nocardia seriolae]BEK91085.1 hypothetical protein NSERKGN1266_70360 [Nocardia seriolae]